MELKAHFSNIHKVIIDHLEQARSEIVAAVAWFTDREIFEVLCKKARSGIKVSVALIGDEINQGPGGLNFHRLGNFGGQVIFLPPGSRNERTMHHKFCVIDRSTVITGSYNWSHKARSNDENITVVTDSTDFAGKYLNTFESLLIRVGQGEPDIAEIGVDAARRRLEMIRNLILLGELDDVATQLRKLRPVSQALQLSKIIAALDIGEYQAALMLIEAYLCKVTAVQVAGLTDIPRLHFYLENLELRLKSLSDERGNLERRAKSFQLHHEEVLGDLIRRIKKARDERIRRQFPGWIKSNAGEKEQAASRDAQEDYVDKSSQHENLKRAVHILKLDEETKREIRSLYRRACGFCHPDKAPIEKKEAAHRVFIELQDSYKCNDLHRVREIHDALAAGGLPECRSSTLSEVESLKAAIAELENAIAEMVADLKTWQESDIVTKMNKAGDTRADWQKYFEFQREILLIHDRPV